MNAIIKKQGLFLTAFLLSLGSAQVASASLIYDSSVMVSGAGFGSIPRDLTVQGRGNQNVTSGCIGLDGTGALTFGTCIVDSQVHDGNGLTNAGGDEPSPQADNAKYGAPLLSDLGITNASQIQIVFDGTQSGGSSITINDLTLKFYNSANQVVGAIDGSQVFDSTVTGNGSAGFVFVVSADERAYVNALISAGAGRMSLEATFTGAAGGPESFFIRAGQGIPNDTPTPEPSTIMSVVGSLGAFAAFRMRRR